MNDMRDPPALEPAIERLERQLERGGLFTHTALSDIAERVTETESFLYGLIDLLVKRGALEEQTLAAASRRVREELDARQETISPGVALRIDPEASSKDAYVAVNCNERLHVCHGVCCKLRFALSQEEVEGGHVRWDLGQPYYVRQEADGRCTHQDRERHCCRVYDQRPRVCRTYSCASDTRIWKDFERMELNAEWLAQNLGPSAPQLVRARMCMPQEHAAADPEEGGA